MTVEIPTLIIELTRLDDGVWDLANAWPDFDNEAWSVRTAFYRRVGTDQTIPLSDSTCNLNSLDEFSKVLHTLESQCNAERQVEVISPFARSVLQRGARLVSIIERRDGFGFLRDHVVDPVQEINEPAILSLAERNTFKLSRFDALARMLVLHEGLRSFRVRDLLYMAVADRRGKP
jgi:hypothetical protein